MTVKQFIWGKDYIDDLIQVSLNSNPSGQSTCDTPYWAMCDANWNVLGLVNSSGTLIERYDYTPYGQRSVYMRSGSGFEGVSGGTNDPGCYLPLAASQRFVTSGSVSQFYGLCEAGFQGLMHDEETGNIYVRHREESPTLGRWMEEDPLGYINGLNLYVEDWDNPIRDVDPQGTGNSGGIPIRGRGGPGGGGPAGAGPNSCPTCPSLAGAVPPSMLAELRALVKALKEAESAFQKAVDSGASEAELEQLENAVLLLQAKVSELDQLIDMLENGENSLCPFFLPPGMDPSGWGPPERID